MRSLFVRVLVWSVAVQCWEFPKRKLQESGVATAGSEKLSCTKTIGERIHTFDPEDKNYPTCDKDTDHGYTCDKEQGGSSCDKCDTSCDGGARTCCDTGCDGCCDEGCHIPPWPHAPPTPPTPPSVPPTPPKPPLAPPPPPSPPEPPSAPPHGGGGEDGLDTTAIIIIAGVLAIVTILMAILAYRMWKAKKESGSFRAALTRTQTPPIYLKPEDR